MEETVFATLKKIIKPQYLEHYRDWVEMASESELNGIEIIDFIMKTRGQRKADDKIKSKEINIKELLDEKFKYFL